MKVRRIHYRQARADDMLDCARVFVPSATDLGGRLEVRTPPPRARARAPAALDLPLRAGFRTEFMGAWMSAAPIDSMESYMLMGGILL